VHEQMQKIRNNKIELLYFSILINLFADLFFIFALFLLSY
jgi:hypothetical protein